jgi:hypothetical protein
VAEEAAWAGVEVSVVAEAVGVEVEGVGGTEKADRMGPVGAAWMGRAAAIRK